MDPGAPRGPHPPPARGDDAPGRGPDGAVGPPHRRSSGAPTAPAHRRTRSSVAGLSAVLAGLVIAASTTAVWLHGTVFDTGSFVDAVAPALDSPPVVDAVAERVTDETLGALAIEDRLVAVFARAGDGLGDALAERLGLTPLQRRLVASLPQPRLRELAGTVASDLEARITRRIDGFVASDRFGDLLVDATREAHAQAVVLVREGDGGLPNAVVEGGEVRLDLVPIVAGVLADVVDDGLDAIGIGDVPVIDPSDDPAVALGRLSSALGVELAPDFGRLTVMSQSRLERLQDVARALDRLVWLLVVVAVALVALTVVVAPDHRRAVVHVALATGVAVTVTYLSLPALTERIAGVATTAQGRSVAVAVTDSVLDGLRTTLVGVLAVALIVAAVAHLVGGPDWLDRLVGWVRRLTGREPAPPADRSSSPSSASPPSRTAR